MHRLLVQRRGHNGVRLARQRHVTGALHIFDRGPACAGADLTDGRLRQRDVRQVQQRNGVRLVAALSARSNDDLIAGLDSEPFSGPGQDLPVANDKRTATVKDLSVLQGLQNDLRPDPGRVTQRNRHERTAVSH